jgi:hypothetical protein
MKQSQSLVYFIIINAKRERDDCREEEEEDVLKLNRLLLVHSLLNFPFQLFEIR